MHDVLAHRISLVALHAGALAYRDDLTREETRETAQTIQANAQLALSELRQVLGVLRAGAGAVGIEPPQPTLAELPALLADAARGRVGGRRSTPPASPRILAPQTLSRTSFRIVQEALTNARKHAPGEPVSVRLAGGPGAQLRDRGAQPGPHAARRAARVASAWPAWPSAPSWPGASSSTGSVPDGSFVVEARLPWPA